MIDKTLIEKFLKGECQPDEAALVLSHLRQNPALIEEFLPESEWDKYVSTQSSATFDEELYGNIQTTIQRSKRKKTIVTTLISAAAALMLFFGIRYLSQSPAGTGSTELASSTATEIIKKNNTKAALSFTLPDSSLVTLAPNSEIKYASNYNVSKREVFLTGKAEFSVAKNKEKQFTVFCGKVATTALGTRFSVDGNSSSISVVLYEGKVVVKKILDETVANYLLPGEKISYNIRKEIFEKFHEEQLASNGPSEAASSKSNAGKNLATDTDPTNTTQPASHIDADIAEKNSRFNFENQNLKTVLDKLAEKFKVEINYPTEISTSINVFISVDTTQSIDKILQNIATINNLELKKVADKKFYISK